MSPFLPFDEFEEIGSSQEQGIARGAPVGDGSTYRDGGGNLSADGAILFHGKACVVAVGRRVIFGETAVFSRKHNEFGSTDPFRNRTCTWRWRLKKTLVSV